MLGSQTQWAPPEKVPYSVNAGYYGDNHAGQTDLEVPDKLAIPAAKLVALCPCRAKRMAGVYPCHNHLLQRPLPAVAD